MSNNEELLIIFPEFNAYGIVTSLIPNQLFRGKKSTSLRKSNKNSAIKYLQSVAKSCGKKRKGLAGLNSHIINYMSYTSSDLLEENIIPTTKGNYNMVKNMTLIDRNTPIAGIFGGAFDNPLPTKVIQPTETVFTFNEGNGTIKFGEIAVTGSDEFITELAIKLYSIGK